VRSSPIVFVYLTASMNADLKEDNLMKMPALLAVAAVAAMPSVAQAQSSTSPHRDIPRTVKASAPAKAEPKKVVAVKETKGHTAKMFKTSAKR
jgi:hypothetical protein